MKRRNFVKLGAIGSTAVIINGCSSDNQNSPSESKPLIRTQNIKAISTWNFGVEANKVALIEQPFIIIAVEPIAPNFTKFLLFIFVK